MVVVVIFAFSSIIVSFPIETRVDVGESPLVNTTAAIVKIVVVAVVVVVVVDAADAGDDGHTPPLLLMADHSLSYHYHSSHSSSHSSSSSGFPTPTDGPIGDPSIQTYSGAQFNPCWLVVGFVALAFVDHGLTSLLTWWKPHVAHR